VTSEFAIHPRAGSFSTLLSVDARGVKAPEKSPMRASGMRFQSNAPFF